MSRPCTICRHPKRDEIEDQIRSGRYNDSRLSEIWKIGRKTFANHKIQHMKEEFRLELKAEVKEANDELKQLNTMADKMNDVESMVRSIFENAKLEGKESLALNAAKELRSQLDTAARVASELRAQAEMQNHLDWKSDWAEVRAILDEVFLVHEEAGVLFEKKLFYLRSESFPVAN